MKLGEALQKGRKAQGLTGVAVARALGVGPARICEWEGGRSVPDADRLARLAEMYGLSVVELDRLPRGRTRRARSMWPDGEPEPGEYRVRVREDDKGRLFEVLEVLGDE